VRQPRGRRICQGFPPARAGREAPRPAGGYTPRRSPGAGGA
jgi:hypothetical protein